METISVIIPAYARHALTVRHVKECMDSTVLPLEIIVVNDGGDPSLKEMLKEIPQKTKLVYAQIEEDILWNYNGAVNLGCWISRGDILAIEDTDHIPARNTYEEGLRIFASRPDIGRVAFARKVTQIGELTKPRSEWVMTDCIGANQMVAMLRRDVYLRLKGQDERFAGRYGYMAYDFPHRRDKILGTRTVKTNYYWAVFGDEGEPGLRRGLHPDNRKLYHENAAAQKNHSIHGILNFHFTFETL